ncbi:hypothetical protein SNE40_015548 [Patella caerulea]|uniref:Cationic amino acid transporter C-terminal domain-containing protein n=1 Tax=Patella caerulea TaxID=87958 RepID=A0AAN8JHK5_PATCE
MMRFLRMLIRTKKIPDEEGLKETSLARVLGAFDLTALGVGSTLGAGIYVVAGQVARQTAGPSVFVSFLVAALASVLAGLCYAEFAARVPKAGSAYVYSYVTVGELMAFIIGWNMILEYAIGTASVARAWSSYFDSLVDNKIQNFFKENMPMALTGLSTYPDFFSFGITLLLTALLAFGVRESAKFNNIFTAVNLLVVLYVVICGLFKVDTKNWSLDPADMPSGVEGGNGGFFPFGFSGMMSGAATCFYAFVGFDCVATTGEEAKNPQRNIPLAIIVSLIIISLAYCSLSAVLTLMCPYYLLDPNAPLPFVFDREGWGVAKYIISVGALCGLSTSLLGAMFPLPRILYAMATDNIIFKVLAQINDRFKTPLLATIITGIFSGLMAMMFNLKELVDMMSIGTLLAYTLVAVCVLILRYRTDDQQPGHTSEHQSSGDDHILFSSRDLFNSPSNTPTKLTQKIATSTISLLCLSITLFCCMIIFLSGELMDYRWWAILLAILPGLSIFVCLFIIYKQPQSTTTLSFKVPAVPLVPTLSVLINIYLMLKLSTSTWIRFGVWMVLGFIIYFGYGIWFSAEGRRLRELTSTTSFPSVYHNVPDAPATYPKLINREEESSIPYQSIDNGSAFPDQ